jgi:hypothetical protein
MTKNFLLVLGVLVLLMGVWGLLAAWSSDLAFGFAVDPWWHAVVKVVLGGAAVYVAYTDK